MVREHIERADKAGEQPVENPTEVTPAVTPVEGTLSGLQGEEVFRSELRSLLQRELPSLYSNELDTPVQVDFPERQGLSGHCFVLTDSSGHQFFLKIRPLKEHEMENGEPRLQGFDLLKAAVQSERVDDLFGVTPEAMPPRILHKEDLPDSFDTIRVGFAAETLIAGEHDYALHIQEFIPHDPMRDRMDNHTLHCVALRDLGTAMRDVNSLEVNGFGSEFDALTNRFSQSWEEYRQSFQTAQKAFELEAAGILSHEEVLQVLEADRTLQDLDPPAVIMHGDLNPGNYCVDEEGHLKEILDWDEVRGGPWQQEYVRGMLQTLTPFFHIPQEQRPERATAFHTGYGLTPAEFAEERETIKAFYIVETVDYLHTLHIVHDAPFEPGAYLEYASGNYERATEAGEERKGMQGLDFKDAQLASEGLLRGLLRGETLPCET